MPALLDDALSLYDIATNQDEKYQSDMGLMQVTRKGALTGAP